MLRRTSRNHDVVDTGEGGDGGSGVGMKHSEPPGCPGNPGRVLWFQACGLQHNPSLLLYLQSVLRWDGQAW